LIGQITLYPEMERMAQQQEWFREVFRNNYKHLHNYLYYLSGDIDWSEDTVQEVFLLLWEKRDTILVDTLKPFLFKVARNLFLKKKRHEAVTLKFARQVAADGQQESPEFELEQQEFDLKLQEAISVLPDQCRTIFLMNRMDEMKYHEVAKALGISQKAVEKQISKALRILREKLIDEDDRKSNTNNSSSNHSNKLPSFLYQALQVFCSGGFALSVVLFLLLFLYFPFSATAQNPVITYSVSEKKLSEVLEDISRSHPVKFAFDAQAFSGIRATVDVRQVSVREFLERLSKQFSLDFKLMEGTWILQLKKTETPDPVLPVATKNSLSGFVSDITTGEPLKYCNIVLSNQHGTSTNDLGYFYMETLSDSVHFFISHLGYQRLDTTVSLDHKNPILLKLKPFTIMMEEIKVQMQEKNMLELSEYPEKIGFNPAKSSAIPRLSENDLVNMLTLIPGVNFLGGQTGGLSIRGGNPSENLILLDGIPVLETGHLFGNLSVLNADFIKQVFVSRGGFDASQGERISGTVELNGKTGFRDHAQMNVSANLLHGNALASVPLSEKFSVTGAWRHSYINQWQNYLSRKLLSDTRLTETSSEAQTTADVFPTVKYQDMNLKMSYHPNKNQELNFSFFGGDDLQTLDYQLAENQFYRNEAVTGNNIGFSGSWSMQTGRWHHSFTAGYSGLNQNSEFQSGEQVEETEVKTNPGNGKGKAIGRYKNYIRTQYELDNDSNYVEELRAGWKTEYKKGIFTYQAGGGFTANKFSYDFYAERTSGNLPVDSLNNSEDDLVWHAFVQQTIAPSSKWKLRWGIRANFDQLTRKVYWQPRGGIEFFPVQPVKFYYLTGIYNQFLSKIPKIDINGNTDMVWYLPDEEGNGLLKATHHVAGFRIEKGGFLFNAELYRKYTSGKQYLLDDIYEKGNVTRIQYTTQSGEELNHGMDLYLQFRQKHWNHMAAYSLARSQEKMTGFNNDEWFPSFNDHRHQLKLTEVFTYRGWAAASSWTYRSGQPRLIAGSSPESPEFERLSNFSQVDFSVIRKFRFKHWGVSGGLTLLNLTNRLNIVEVDYLNIATEVNTFSVRSNVSAPSLTPVFFVNVQIF